jgi:hypothetical protein
MVSGARSYQGTFPPSSITRQNQNGLAVVNALEALAQIPLEQVNLFSAADGVFQRPAAKDFLAGVFVNKGQWRVVRALALPQTPDSSLALVEVFAVLCADMLALMTV